MDIENLSYSERKFVVLVQKPKLTDHIINYGSWALVSLPRLGWELYKIFAQQNLPALIQVTPDNAETLVFPPSHPQIDTVYTAHPIAPSLLYCVTATFHQRLFEERVAEFARVMRCAGASKVTIDAERKTGSETEAIGKVRAAITADPKAHVRQTSSTRLTISFRGGRGKPTELPPDLLFFRHEPTWIEIYDAAVTSGIESYDVELETKDDFGLDAQIAGEFLKHGFKIGGRYEHHVYHRLKGKVEFRQGA